MKKILVLLLLLGWYPGQPGFAISNAANSGELYYMHKLAKFYLEFSREARTWLEGYQQSISGPELRLEIGHHAIETLKIKIQSFAKTDNKPRPIR